MMAAKKLDGAVDRTNIREDELPASKPPPGSEAASQRVSPISGVHSSVFGALHSESEGNQNDEHVATAMQLLTWLEQRLSAPPSGHAADEARERARMLRVLEEARASLSEHARIHSEQHAKT